MTTKLKETIRNSGLKQRFIAAKIGMHPTYLSQIVNGRRPIRDKDKQALAGFFGLAVGDLFVDRV